jgi:hypothetical protein
MHPWPHQPGHRQRPRRLAPAQPSGKHYHNPPPHHNPHHTHSYANRCSRTRPRPHAYERPHPQHNTQPYHRLHPAVQFNLRPLARITPSSPSKETVPGPSPSPLRLAANATPTDLSAGPLITDRLGKLVQQATEALESTSFEELCVHHRGPSCLTGGTRIPHPAADILRELRDVGAPVSLSGTEWTPADLDAAVLRGAHRSTAHCRDFLREEFADMMEAGQWLVVPYYAIRHLLGLRLSPTGVVPQANRRDRLIVDYSFSFVNQETERLAPDSLQFGFALYRILRLLQQADTRNGPIYLAKIDVTDAFMRVAILAAHIPSLGALLPSYPGEVPLVAFPLILPMGWIESPQYLCAVSETIADMANDLFEQGHVSATPHRLVVLADSRPEKSDRAAKPLPFAVPPPLVRSQGPLQRPLNTVDVYMDDFILLSQGNRADRTSSRRTVFECIDSVLRPLSPGANPKRKEPNSTKKLAQGDASWATTKSILGWHFDTTNRTIQLPPHRLDRLQFLLSSIGRHQRRTSRRKWQQLVGELRSILRPRSQAIGPVATLYCRARPIGRFSLVGRIPLYPSHSLGRIGRFRASLLGYGRRLRYWHGRSLARPIQSPTSVTLAFPVCSQSDHPPHLRGQPVRRHHQLGF